MKSYRILLWSILCFVFGCSATPEMGNYSADFGTAESERFVVRTASVSIEVEDIDRESSSIINSVKEIDGYVENTYRRNEKNISITVRIPEPRLDSFIDGLPKYGDITSKSLSAKDVTEEMVDVEAKLKNLVALRNRYRELLARADKVSDVLDVERELSRVQTEIDAIEGRRAKLMGQINYSKVDIYVEQKTIYGPIGYIGLGLYWVVEKLFVIK